MFRSNTDKKLIVIRFSAFTSSRHVILRFGVRLYIDIWMLKRYDGEFALYMQHFGFCGANLL